MGCIVVVLLLFLALFYSLIVQHMDCLARSNEIRTRSLNRAPIDPPPHTITQNSHSVMATSRRITLCVVSKAKKSNFGDTYNVVDLCFQHVVQLRSSMQILAEVDYLINNNHPAVQFKATPAVVLFWDVGGVYYVQADNTSR